MLYTGIDVGAKGGIVTIDEKCKVIDKQGIPLIGSSVDRDMLQKKLDSIYNMVAIEDVHSIYGASAKSNFNFGFIKGYKAGCLPYCNITFVQPKTRQKTAWLRDDIVYKSTEPRKVKDTKATSLNAAQRIFPGEDWRSSSRQRKQQDGLYDAALIAYRLMKQNEEPRSIYNLTH